MWTYVYSSINSKYNFGITVYLHQKPVAQRVFFRYENAVGLWQWKQSEGKVWLRTKDRKPAAVRETWDDGWRNQEKPQEMLRSLVWLVFFCSVTFSTIYQTKSRARQRNKRENIFPMFLLIPASCTSLPSTTPAAKTCLTIKCCLQANTMC